MLRMGAFVTLFLLAATAYGAQLPQGDAVPGGIALVVLPPHASRASYAGRRVMILPHDGRRYAVVGVPLDTPPGRHQLAVVVRGGTRNVAFDVADKAYAVQRLTIKNKAMVTLSPADLARVERESKVIDAVYDTWTPKLYARLPFLLPVQGVETSPFGVRRVLNGKPRSPHSGIDIAARAGTPVRAPAAGIVAVVGDFFFNGHTVIINHGRGLVSVYVHLDKIDVAKGDRVARGQVIGTVGATGRTTGADLHWTVTLNGTKVNPELLLSPAELASLQR